jgi:hypothetical protein
MMMRRQTPDLHAERFEAVGGDAERTFTSIGRNGLRLVFNTEPALFLMQQRGAPMTAKE